jgi:filamentous hemagglutinin family protein
MIAHEFALTSRGRSRRAARISLKPLVLALSAAGLMVGAVQAAGPTTADNALPTGMNRISGSVEVSVNEATSTMTVTQTSDKAVLTANEFNIGAKAAFVNNGPSANSDTLIRVIGGNPSAIYGSLTANNRLWLVNASGMYVGANASISAASLLMSARDVDAGEVAGGYANFLAGKPVPFLAGANSNDYGGGFIEIDAGAKIMADNGLVMIAPRYIHNQGTVAVANGGELTMLAANSAEVEIGDSGYISLAPRPASVDDNDSRVNRAIFNDDTGVIQADGGRVNLIVAGTGNDGVSLGFGRDSVSGSDGRIVNGVLNEGQILALSGNGTGSVHIEVKGLLGQVNNVGTINVSAPGSGGFGGSIDVVAPNVLIGSDNADVPARLLADGPQGGGQITLAASGGTGNSIVFNPRSLVSASSTDNGDGGSIRVLGAPNVNAETSTGLTPGNLTVPGTVWLQGAFKAQGGQNGGNGGQFTASGTVVNLRTFDDSTETVRSAVFDLSASKGLAGTWSLYSPTVLIGSESAMTDRFGTQVFEDDLNTLLNTGANVKIGTYADAETTRPQVEVLDGTHIQSGFSGAQELAIESVDSVYLGRSANSFGSDILIESTQGPLSVKLTADSDNNGVGDLTLVGRQFVEQTSVPGRAFARASSNGSPVEIRTNGGDITVKGRHVTLSGAALGDAVLMDNVVLNAGTGNVTISGEGGIRGEGSDYLRGVAIYATDIFGANISIFGGSLGSTGVLLNDVNLSVNPLGKVDVVGYTTGVPAEGEQVGLDVVRANVRLGDGSELKFAGHAGGTGVGAGLRIGDLDITAPRVGETTIAPRITLAGQSDQSIGAGLEVTGGVAVYATNTEGELTQADVVIGAKASSIEGADALRLGSYTYFGTTGRINVRPMTVSKTGALGEDTATPIHIGQRPDEASPSTNFFVDPNLFNGYMGRSLNVIVGSSLHTGRITTDTDVFLDPTAIATLQNQGATSGGIVIAKQGGDPIIEPDLAGRARAQAVDTTTTTSAGVLNLVTGGDVTQTGPIVAQAVNVVTTPQAAVTLNNPDNQINSILISGGSAVAVTPGATPSASGAITVFDASGNQFRTINATSNTGEPQTPVFEVGIAPSISTIESSGALDELRTDVYVRGQFSRPQVCTPANTGGGVSTDLDADPLAQQWLQVRRSAQLSSCSSVRNDSNCSAF